MTGTVHMHLSYPRREDDPYPTALSLDCMHAPDRAERVGRARMKWARRQRRRARRRRRPCPECGGSGQVQWSDVEPECCGNTTSSGECRGDCAVPVEVPRVDVCPTCGGSGKVPGDG